VARSIRGLVSDPPQGSPNLPNLSEDLELSVTFGGPGFNRGFYSSLRPFIFALLDEVERIRNGYVIEQVAVVPEAVWRGVALVLCDVLLGNPVGVRPPYFRDVFDDLCPYGLHAFALLLDSVGLSFRVR